MDFTFTPEQQDLRETVRGVLDKECPPAVARAVLEGEGPGPTDRLWATLVGLDWPALALPEEVHGLGATWVEQGIVIEELGRAIAPGPFVPTVTQFAPAVLECGTPEQIERFVGPLAGGSTGALAVDEGAGTWSAADVTAAASWDEDRITLSGSKRFVVDGATADEVAVAVRLDGDVRVLVVPGPDLAAAPLEPIDPTTPHADLALDGVRVAADRLLGDDGDAGAALTRAVEEATTAVALTTVGACGRILEMTVDYAKEREQFGVPIGSFQAVKHKLADLYRDQERAAALAHFAALCIAEDDPRRTLATAMAKAAAGDLQRRAVKDGLQLHGGIGYTWEHDLHLLLRRAKVGELHFGTAARHARAVAEQTMASASA